MSQRNGNGYPYPPPPNLPPFRPNYAPGPPRQQRPPYGQQGGYGNRPPFPPSYPPNGAGSPGQNIRPPPSNHYPSRPAIGLPPAPSGLPNNPHSSGRRNSGTLGSGPAEAANDSKTIKVFVGSIAPGIKDRTLRDLLNACGRLHELKRVEGANGKPQAFGFASFDSPESVLRCIRCLNGVELPDQTPEGRAERKPSKPLVVKADQKTAEFLQGFEETIGRTEIDENEDAVARRSIQHIVSLLSDPNADGDAKGASGARAGQLSPIQVVVPAHLQDLKEGDLPESQRVQVLDQIAIFRENAARREREKKMADDERERFKPNRGQGGHGAHGGHGGYGYGNRSQGGHGGAGAGAGTGVAERKDPQGYSEPVAFVRAETAEGKGDQRTDEEDEEIRRQRRERERALALRDRENRVESRERQRIESALREESVRQQRTETEERSRRITAEDLANWDDAEVEERGKELFYVDRAQWRSQRQQQRLREEQDDIDDRRQEDVELKALEEESEDFLRKQMAEFTAMEEKSREAGLLTDDAAPVKLALAINAPAVLEPKEEAPAALPVPVRPAVALGDDEDETMIQRRKRTMVKLEYEPVYSEAEETAKRNARLVDIGKQLPTSTRSVFEEEVNWAVLQGKTTSKIQKFVDDEIRNIMGSRDQDLVDFVMENVEQRKAPRDMVEELSDVLDEDAEKFVVHLWRQLLLETKASELGLDSGTVFV